MSVKDNFSPIKPSLLLDFANAKVLDPRITFSRASTAVVYDGKTVAKAEENLLLQSQTFDNASWGKTQSGGVTVTANSTAAPDGTTTADTATPNASSGYHVLRQAGNTAAAVHTYSVFVKPNGYTKVGIREDYVGGQYATFDATSTGTVIAQTGGTTASITALANGWYRIVLTPTTASASQGIGIYIMDASYTSGDPSAYTYTGDGTSGIYLWGAQLEQRSSVSAYTPTTTQPITNYIPTLLSAPANVARFDHNPVTGESLGLRVEEQRTNLLTYSEQFDNAAWTKGNATVTANIIVAPDGTLTGEKLVENTSSSPHQVYQGKILTAASYTLSFYAKAGERTTIAFTFDTSGNTWAYINLSTGTVSGSMPAEYTVNSITNVGNGWFRVSVSRTATATTYYANFATASGTSVSYAGDGYSGIYIWGAQLEAGSFATSYIKTEASQVTRSADAASMTGTNFSSWYRADEGTLYAEAVTSKPTGGVAIATAYLPSSQGIEMTVLNTNAKFGVVVNGAYTANLTLGVVSANNPFKVAGTYKIDDIAGSLNSGAVSTDTSAAVPSATLPTTLFIGGYAAAPSASYALAGTIKKLAYYPIRCTNLQLQALTS